MKYLHLAQASGDWFYIMILAVFSFIYVTSKMAIWKKLTLWDYEVLLASGVCAIWSVIVCLSKYWEGK